jgi:predicted nucleic acid-binding protein
MATSARRDRVLLADNFPHTKFLGPEAAGRLLGDLQAQGIAGGGVYDALVAATAAEHRLALATRDRRALGTYRRLGVEAELVT